MDEFVKKFPKDLKDDYSIAILRSIENEKDENLIFLALSQLKCDQYKIAFLERLDSLKLKSKLLNTIKDNKVKLIGIESLYSKKDNSGYIEGLMPPELAFGVELESVGDKASLFVKSFNYKDWSIIEEGGLGSEGVEFISPTMHYRRENLTSIHRVCDFMKKNGLYINIFCGGHIHYGFDYVSKLREFINLIIFYAYFEKELYLISSSEESRIRPNVNIYAKSIISQLRWINSRLEKPWDSEEEFYKDLNKNILDGFHEKTMGFNIANINDPNKNTIEIRIPNGTIEYEELHRNIILFGSMFKYVKEVSSSNDLQSNFHDTVSKRRKSEERLEILTDLLFLKNEDLKDKYISRYNIHVNDYILKELSLKGFNLKNYKSLRKTAEK